jgi:RHS repeat-associated protein
VDFDSGQDGWVATNGFAAIVPAAPTLISPGDGSTVPVITTLTPAFQWNAVLGANGYGLYVQEGSSFPVDTDTIGNTTSYTVATGVLQPGTLYVWNMRARDSAGFSPYSSGTSGLFYFQTPSAPLATTLSPSDVTATTATLIGNLNANGASTSYYFQYGLTASYGSTTLVYSIGTGSGNYGIAVSGLTANTTYHYRVVAYNTVNTTYGGDVSFMTSTPPPANDNFANRTTITAPNLTVTGSNVNATKEAGEPNHAGGAGGKSVWWTWTPSTSGSATISTAGSSFDTLLAVYTGTSVSALTTIESNDDDTAHGVSTSLLTFNAVAGTAYQIVVDGNAGSGGSVQLAITPPSTGPAPVANFYGDLRPVTGKLSTYYGSLSTGTAPLSYSWTTTAGHASTAVSPSFAFNSPGTYTINLTVTDGIGRTSPTASATVYVQAANNGSTPGQPVGADPVVLSAGNYVQERVDLKLPGKGFPFEFKRFYNSKFGDQTGLPLGYGWTHSYNERIKDNGTNALIVRGDGSTWMFSQSGGIYTAEPGVFDSLATNSVAGGWLLTDKNQMVKRFNTNGYLASITDKNGNTLTNIYDGNVLRQIQDTAGRMIVLNTNPNGCISDITDSIGRTIHYGYDAQTNLVSVTDANGNVSSNRYDPVFHQMTDAFDAKGNCFVHNEYNTNDFTVTRQRDALTNWTSFFYSTNRITYQTNALGMVSVHTFDTNLLATNIVDEAGNQQSFGYDGNRNRILVRDKRGNATSCGYDASGNVTNKIDALNFVTSVDYSSINNPTRRVDALNHTTAFAYNASGNLTQTTNALNQITVVDYTSAGLPLVLTDANGHKTTNTFDAQGNLTKVQDALGNTTSVGYDGAGRKIAQTNANNQVTRYFYDNNDNLVRVIDPLGGTNSFIYDVNNNRVVTMDARGGATTNTFDTKDRLIAVRDAAGGVTSTEYDALDRKTKVTDARSGVTRFGYNFVGNVIAVTNALNQVTRYTYDGNGNQTSIINPVNQTTTNIFDPLNRLVVTIDPLNHTNETVYDAIGRRVQTIDALSRTNQFAYDFVGRLIQVTDLAAGTMKFIYDNVGNRLVTTDPNNHSATNNFDALNRLATTREPGGGVYQFFYDCVGNLTNQIDPKLQSIRYTCDGNNRKTGITYPSGSPVTFGYDANGNRTNMTDALGTTIYQYDALNRLVSVTDPFGKTVGGGYDANGNRSSLTYPGGKTVAYGYDSLNRMVSVTNWLNGVSVYAYDAAGNLINTFNPNGSSVDFGYDFANRLIAMTNSCPSSAIISSYAYTLDAVGNHTQVDQVEQLQTLPVVGSFSYIYDNDNRMLTFEGQPEAFDADGNMISINVTNLLSYDFENRLTQTAFAGVTNSYQYDGAGNRLAATRERSVTRYVLDRSNPLKQVLAETDSGGTITAYYVYGLGLISRIDAAANASYYHFDSRGSTVATTDGSGQITEAYAYDPFGRPRNASVSDNRFRYLGRHGVMDEFNGLDYIRARYYSTRRGRFISKDPTTGNDNDGQSLNRYVYALNNPIRLIDISGLSPREASHTSIVFATSDSSLLHNLLISPSTLGLDTRIAGSTPQLQTVAKYDSANPKLTACKVPDDVTIIRAATTQELIYQRELELMHIEASPFAYSERLDFIHENPGTSLFILKQAQSEILGSDYKRWPVSDYVDLGIFGFFGAAELIPDRSQQPAPR